MIAWLRGSGGLAWTFLWVSGARATMLGFSLLGSIIIYRGLASESPDMVRGGAFAISMAVVRSLTNSVGGAADLAVLRRAPVLLKSDPTAAEDVIRAAFLLRIFVIVMLAAAAVLQRLWFADRFPPSYEHSDLALLICAAAAGELLLRSVLAVFQSSEQFGRFVAFESLFQGGRLVAVLGLIALGWLSVTTILVSYALMGFVAASMGALRLPHTLFTVRPVPRSVLKDTARFFGLTLIALGLSAATERLDLFLLGHFRGVAEAGLYGGVLTLAVIPDFVGGLLATVLQPRVVRLREQGQFRSFNNRLLLLFAPPGLLALAVVIIGGDTIVSVVLGAKFAAGALAFKLLASGSIVGLMVSAVPAILISVTSPRTTTALTIMQSVSLLALGALLIPSYGVTGAAALVAGTRVAISLMIQFIGLRMTNHPVVAEIPSTN